MQEEEIFEMAGNSPHLITALTHRSKKFSKYPCKINTKKITPKYLVTKLLKFKHKKKKKKKEKKKAARESWKVANNETKI